MSAAQLFTPTAAIRAYNLLLKATPTPHPYQIGSLRVYVGLHRAGVLRAAQDGLFNPPVELAKLRRVLEAVRRSTRARTALAEVLRANTRSLRRTYGAGTVRELGRAVGGCGVCRHA